MALVHLWTAIQAHRCLLRPPTNRRILQLPQQQPASASRQVAVILGEAGDVSGPVHRHRRCHCACPRPSRGGDTGFPLLELGSALCNPGLSMSCSLSEPSSSACSKPPASTAPDDAPDSSAPAPAAAVPPCWWSGECERSRAVPLLALSTESVGRTPTPGCDTSMACLSSTTPSFWRLALSTQRRAKQQHMESRAPNPGHSVLDKHHKAHELFACLPRCCI